MVPAYDHPTLWSGHASMIEEIAVQTSIIPKAILCSVGGGGLIGGILVGCSRVGWDKGAFRVFVLSSLLQAPPTVPIVALETQGSDCFYHSLMLNRPENKSYTRPESVRAVPIKHGLTVAEIVPKSRASSLTASSPAARVVEMALEHPGYVRCVTVPDELSMAAALRFACKSVEAISKANSLTTVAS